MVTHCFMLYALLASSVAQADYLDDRIARVFPFEVGQEYEFQSALDFHRPNGEILPAFTVANVTVTDTVINDTTWLHIPYWSPFGTEYYRLDDSARVWNKHIEDGTVGVLLDLNNRTDADLPLFSAFGWTGWTVEGSHVSRYWTEQEGDSALAYAFQPSLTIPDLGTMHGWHISGSAWTWECFSCSANAKQLRSAFRPVSDEPWPDLYGGFFVGIQQTTPHPAELSITAVPNPFNPQTVLRFDIPESGAVRLAVYDVTGRMVRTLVDHNVRAGSHEVTWNGRDDAGRTVASGVYIVRIAGLVSGQTAVAKVTLVR